MQYSPLVNIYAVRKNERIKVRLRSQLMADMSTVMETAHFNRLMKVNSIRVFLDLTRNICTQNGLLLKMWHFKIKVVVDHYQGVAK